MQHRFISILLILAVLFMNVSVYAEDDPVQVIQSFAEFIDEHRAELKQKDPDTVKEALVLAAEYKAVLEMLFKQDPALAASNMLSGGHISYLPPEAKKLCKPVKGKAPALPSFKIKKAGEKVGLSDIPPGLLKRQLLELPEKNRDAALGVLSESGFDPSNAPDLRAGDEGGIHYTCIFDLPAEAPAAAPEVAGAPPAVDVFTLHSKPGSPNKVFLDFDGGIVSGTAWNSNYNGGADYDCMEYDPSGDPGVWSETEQWNILRVWERVAEDMAPFDIDVTTEDPGTLNATTGWVLITRNVDALGADLPLNTGGGVAWLSVFGSSNYPTMSPAFVYWNKLGGGREDYVAEASTHEFGHNLSLNHDGTSTVEYYGGHGSGDIRWGPIMGTGYGDAVSQFTKGEYYDANNTEDDLARIAARLTYMTDEHGDNNSTATFVSFEADQITFSSSNGGIIQTTSDVDVFCLAAGAGALTINADPYICGAHTKGGNLDIQMDLYNSAGILIATSNPPDQTIASITTTVSEGAYYVHITGVGAGDPFSSTPTGYTEYGSLGQYFLSGTRVQPSGGDLFPPTAVLSATDVTSGGGTTHQITVTYTDNNAVDVSTIDGSDIVITGPNAFSETASFAGIDFSTDGSPRVVTYQINAPAGSWDFTDNGTYNVWLQTNEVADIDGSFVADGLLGSFFCEISNAATLYEADMTSDPGWAYTGGWAYGTPSSTTDPTDRAVVGYVITGTGKYPNGMTSTEYTTTPAFDCTGYDTVTLRFNRFMGTKNGDESCIQISDDNGSTWSNVEYSNRSINDSSWIAVQYDISSQAGNNTQVRLRWGIGPTSVSQDHFGWNIDNVVVSGSGAGGTDKTKPVAVLNTVAPVVDASPNHDLNVTFTDNSAMDSSDFNGSDIRVTGPNAFDQLASYQSVDTAGDGTPRTVTYRITAPGGTWDASDNGTYSVMMMPGEVSDTSENYVDGGALGNFTVNLTAGGQPSIVTDGGSVSVPEGGTATFQVKLSLAPSATVAVSVSRISGDTDITVNSGASLSFTTTNWNTYQTVTLAAAEDNSDTVNGTASIECSSADAVNNTVTANENDDDFTLTVSAGANGSTTPSGSQIVDQDDGPYAVIAVPDGGYQFSDWTVEAGTASFADANSASTTVTAAADCTVMAHFAINPVQVVTDVDTVTVDEGGSASFQVKLDKDPGGAVTVSVARSSGDTDITVSAGATLNFDSGSWDTYQPVSLDCAEDDTDTSAGTAVISCTSVSASNKDVTANENDDDFTLTVTDDGHGSTVPSGATIVDQDDSPYAISTTADIGYHFVNWTVPSGAGTFGDANLASTNVTASADITVQANFAINQYTVTFTPGANGTISGTTPQTIDHGNSTTAVTAVPNGTFRFSTWSGDYSGTDNPLVINNVTGDLNITANFVANNAPTVATPAAASEDPVNDTDTLLTVLGADDGGEDKLTYTWITTGTPPAAVTFSPNGTNGAKSSTAVFTKAGAYDFQVTIEDPEGESVTDTVSVTVNAVLSNITISPSFGTVQVSSTFSFTADSVDQFGDAMAPAITWSVSGGGTIDGSGLFTAGAVAGGPHGVMAESGPISGTASIFIEDFDLTTGLIAYFPFDETSGDDIENKVTSVNEGLNHGSEIVKSTVQAGLLGNARKLVSVDQDWIDLNISGTWQGFANDSHTIALWFKPDQDLGLTGSLYNQAYIISADDDTRVLYNQPGLHEFRMEMDVDNLGVQTAADLGTGITHASGAWYHLIIVVDEGTANRMYVNGILIVERTNVWPGATVWGTVPGTWKIGNSTTKCLSGTVDELRIYNYAFTSQDATDLYNYRPDDVDSDGMADEWEFTNFSDLQRDGLGDIDGDLLSDRDEFLNDTDPWDTDTDDDGYSDNDEVLVGSDPNNPLSVPQDKDGDGMIDTWEVTHFGDTDRDGSGDLDGDGLSDLQEFRNNTDPDDTDTDDDGLTDGEELDTYFTDPTVNDHDGDGMFDGWEIDNSFDPFDDSDGPVDTDTDGLTNLEEFQHGTDPRNPDTDGDGYTDGEEVDKGYDPLGIVKKGDVGCSFSEKGDISVVLILLVLSILGLAIRRKI